ncbi:MAG: hypothetical protein NTZ26_04885 [Candidatus Aminicenantes bacterium]|nr:hypothetical protein [Candidatus Aminicenantes bacterium]
MNIGTYGILIVFGVFILLLIRNPNMACFGKKLKSPFYPILRRKRMQREAEAVRLEKRKRIQTSDYGFKLDEPGAPRADVSPEAKAKAEDYGFKLD